MLANQYIVTIYHAGRWAAMHRHSLPLIAMLLIMLVTCAVVHAAERCNRCGREIGQDWRFCAYCGVPLEPLTPTERPWESPGTRAGQEIIGPDGGALVWVWPGEFIMGSGDGHRDEQPVHPVRITRGFWLGTCEVTVAQYRQFCEASGRVFAKDNTQGDLHPVAYVGWEDAMAYCRHYGLGLPTEAQWEYAASSPQSRWYPWGWEWDPGRCRHQLNLGSGGRTFPIGSFPAGASWCGALDMAGNVWEWCADWHDEKYYQTSPLENPRGPATGQSRVMRGGSWAQFDYGCRCARRYSSDTVHGDCDVGFRVASTP